MKKKIVMLIYMAGDNDLTAAGDADIKELRAVGSTENVSFLLEFDRADDSKTVRYEIGVANEDGLAPLVVLEEMDETDSGNPASLKRFIHWGIENYQAEEYILILWNHGGGFKFRKKLENLYHSNDNRLFKGRKSIGKNICWDDLSGNAIDLMELKNVFKDEDQTFSMIGFDACLMGMIEVVYQLKDFSSTFCVSQELIPWLGWPYHLFSKRMTANNPIKKTGGLFVDDYLFYYEKKGERCNFSFIDSLPLKKLIGSLNKVADCCIEMLKEDLLLLLKVRHGVQTFDSVDYIDLGDFVRLLKEKIALRHQDDNIKKVLDESIENFEFDYERAIIHSGFRGEGLSHSTGLSLWFPIRKDNFNKNLKDYEKLDFAKDCYKWVVFLNEFFRKLEM